MTAEELLKLVGALGLGSVIGGVVTAFVKERFDKLRRADASALKLLEAKLRAYEVIQPALIKAVQALATQVQARELAIGHDADAAADVAFEALWVAERQYAHVLSNEVVAALAKYHHVRFVVLAREGKELLGEVPQLHDAIVLVNAAIRKDCRTDALERNTEQMIAGLIATRTKHVDRPALPPPSHKGK